VKRPRDRRCAVCRRAIKLAMKAGVVDAIRSQICGHCLRQYVERAAGCSMLDAILWAADRAWSYADEQRRRAEREAAELRAAIAEATRGKDEDDDGT
jgi:hypothetical protein